MISGCSGSGDNEFMSHTKTFSAFDAKTVAKPRSDRAMKPDDRYVCCDCIVHIKRPLEASAVLSEKLRMVGSDFSAVMVMSGFRLNPV
jgi:hypothetical protein